MRVHGFVLVVPTLVALSAAPAQGGRKAPDRPETPPLQVAQRPLAQSVALGGVRAEIGREDEAGPYMFGSFGGVAMGGDGTIYVPENSTSEIRIFNQAGSHLGTFGRRGRGPGEFVNPVVLVHDGDSTMFAWQQFFGITELTARGAHVRFRRTFGAGADYSSICTLGTRVFVSAGGDTAVIRELDGDRKEVRAFGSPFDTFMYGRPNEAARRFSRRDGPTLLCDTPRSVLYAFRGDQGTIRAYEPDGRLRWETTLPSFKVGFYGANPDGAPYVVWSLDYIATFMPLGGSRLLVQVARRDLQSIRGRSRAPGALMLPDVAVVAAYILEARSGRIVSRSPGAGLIGALADTLVAETVMDPWPMLRLRPVRARVP